MVKILKITMDNTPLHKTAPFGIFHKKVTQTNQNLETLFFKNTTKQITKYQAG
jgi:hypothetical protein